MIEILISRIFTYAAIVFLAVSKIALAAPLEAEGVPTIFVGQDSHSKSFEIKLTRIGDSVRGSFRYAGEASPEILEGRISPDGDLELVETRFGNIYGRFKAKLIGNRLNGDWDPVGATQTISFATAAQSPPPQNVEISNPPARNEPSPVSDSAPKASTNEKAMPVAHPTNLVEASPKQEQPPTVITEQQKSVRGFSEFGQYVLVCWLSVVILGIFLGLNEKIVVFRNYNDMAIAFCSGLSIAASMVLLFAARESQQILSIFLFAISAVGVIWMIGRTFIDNRNPVFAMVALITKLTLFVLFIFNLIDFVTPSGKTARERASSRRSSFIMLLVLAPITMALVKEKKGLFSPDRILQRRFR